MMIKSLRKIYNKHYKFHNPKILGRVACLGTDILTNLNLQKGLHNHQKSRVDFLLELNLNKSIKPNSSDIYEHLEKKYIIDCITQQEDDFFLNKKPDYIVIDSFSELTDQLFVSKNDNKHFLANYSDVKHSEKFNSEYECLGLLSKDKFYETYLLFFNKLNNAFPNVPIIFIHFPAVLDKREVFRERAKKILNVIEKISETNLLVKSISIDDNMVTKSENEIDELKDFPYHYGEETYVSFQKMVSAIMLKS